VFRRSGQKLLRWLQGSNFSKNALDTFLSYVENLIITSSGVERLIRWRNTLFRDDDGRVIGTLSSGEDMTDRKAAEEALRRLPTLLLPAQDEERRRVAREVHDGIGQYITALNLAIGKLRRKCIDETDPESQQALSECRALIEAASHEIRTISYLLHPPTIDDLGLRSALQWLVDGYGKRSALQVSLEAASDLGRFKPEIEMTLFRIAQESLTNIHRHSESATAIIRVVQRSDEIVLEVADRGKGMPTSARGADRGPGIGLAGIEQRLTELKGRFSLESSPSQGVTIHVALPMT
jgi:signal transduction histidine kinase